MSIDTKPTPEPLDVDDALAALVRDVCTLPVASQLRGNRWLAEQTATRKRLADLAANIAAQPLMARWPSATAWNAWNPDPVLAFVLGRVCAAIDCANREQYDRALSALAFKLREARRSR